MKLKLTYIQFMALYAILRTVALAEMPIGIEARRDRTIVVALYQKFYAKAFEKKKSYSIRLHAHEAMTFYIYFSGHDFPSTTLEGNLLDMINNSIHQKFAA